MFAKLVITFRKTEDMHYNMTSLMQGVLMEFIDKEYADKLHESGLNPYSQHVEFTKEYMYWVIAAMTEEAVEKIIKPLLSDDIREFYIEHKDLKIEIINRKVTSIAYDKMLENTYFGKCSPYINISFLTPTSFKVNGRYQNYPTVSHIFHSLIMKHDTIAEGTEIYSDDIAEQIESNIHIIKYNLRSTLFHMESVKIPSFVGNITMKVNGPQQFVNLINFLVETGVYSGVGIKTAIGMGAIKIERRN